MNEPLTIGFVVLVFPELCNGFSQYFRFLNLLMLVAVQILTFQLQLGQSIVHFVRHYFHFDGWYTVDGTKKNQDIRDIHI